MVTVTLNHEQFLRFTRWSDSHCMKQIVGSRTRKIQKMGAEVVTITGKGRGSKYTLLIPAGFWSMLLIDGMSYSPIGAEYIDCIINGRDIANTEQGSFVKFTNELYSELTMKYGAEYKAVEATCTRIRNYLREHGYISTDSPKAPKTHRVKRSKHIGGIFVDAWVADEEAIAYDRRAREIWSSFFKKKLAAYREIAPEAESIPFYMIAKELKQLYSFGMKEQLDVDYYRVANKTEVNDALSADIDYVRNKFIETLDLDTIRSELRTRQTDYRRIKQLQREHAELQKAEFEARKPSKEELQELRKQMFVAEVQNESMAPPMTEDDRKKIDAALDEILLLIDKETE